MGAEESKYNISPMSSSDDKVFELTQRPTPSDREVIWDKTKTLLCKTDSKGTIMYANEAFIDVCGYDDFELITKSCNITRHPDMPRVIFKIMWEIISEGKHFITLVKNMAKTGRYYWVINEINTATDKNGEYTYTSRQNSLSEESKALKKVITLYKKLLHIEQASGVVASENYLIGFLEERNQTFVEYITSILESNNSDENEVVENNVEAAMTSKVIEKTVSENSDTEGSDIIKIKKKGFFTGFFANEEEK
ncbi:PAS domain-containing protein [Flavobacterium ajazii]|uniref:PAS domain-containing protein n=1 Tax=Flavobacterium ajazii TaxID=2692318 RepID=UPI001FE7E139|nr:PAS domain-containing protein [Flavobacterium ajazii]